VLDYLASRPGRLVAKDELLDMVWPATHVTSSVLAGCIHELRLALGDDPHAPRFVETAHGRGYRFVAVPAPSARAPGRGDVEIALLARRFADAVAQVVARVRRDGISGPDRFMDEETGTAPGGDEGRRKARRRRTGPLRRTFYRR
jgi:hypothetical protein